MIIRDFLKEVSLLGTGYLTARVYTSRSAIPVEDVSISVVAENNGGNELLGFRSTDASGNIDPIALPAPDRELSEQPFHGQQPFSSYRLQADHPNYKTVVVRDIQLFDGETSLQNIELIPLEETPTPERKVEVFPIVPQNL